MRPDLRRDDRFQGCGDGTLHVLVGIAACLLQRRRGIGRQGPEAAQGFRGRLPRLGQRRARPAISTGTVFAATSAEAG